jgi:hypothetical protein
VAGVALGLAAMALLCASALSGVAYMLWPRWPQAEAAPGAPTLPITVSGVLLNVPPAAIRFPPQQRPGAQARLDLAFLWPQLAPPEPNAAPPLSSEPQPPAQVFLTIAAPQGSLPAGQRLKSIYPRYMAPAAFVGPAGLTGVPFRDSTPYQGEDVLFDPDRPDRFIVRCTRSGATPGTCLMERQVGTAELTVRFPRDWLESWPTVVDSVEQLMERMGARG